MEEKIKFCKFCGEKIPEDAVICTKCGRQVEEVKKSGPDNIVINNTANANASYPGKGPYNKWVAFCLCFFLGVFGGHKFYEGKVGLGVLYIFTAGLCGIGVFIDLITILFKPNEYYI